MSDNSLAIFESLIKEFSCDESGNGFISLRGLARLCGTKRQSWGQGGSIFTQKIDENLTQQGLNFENVVVKGVPDTVAAVVIAHYAHQGKSEARQALMAFGAYGLRTLIQKVAGYKGTKTTYTLDAIVRREPMAWERMFQQSWIDAAEKLTGRSWNHSLTGHFINDTVYAYMPEHVMEAIRDLNPRTESGKSRVHKHHQFLQPEIREMLSKHLDKIETLMNAANGNKELFRLLMINNFGRYRASDGDQISLFRTETVFIFGGEAG